MQFIDLHAQYQALQQEIDENIRRVLEHGKYIMGPEVGELEEKLAAYVGRRHCITCANGTDALSLVLMAWGVGPGDAVFVPSFTFMSTAEVVSLVGAEPVFVDVEEDTFNMDPESLLEAIARVDREGRLRKRAVIPVDLFGLPADYRRILPIAEAHGLKVLEDGAQGFGGTLDGKTACAFGDASTTSFFPAKPLGCYGDGGAVFTDDDTLAGLLQSIRIHGKGSEKYDNVRVGLNSRLDTLQAAILQPKLAAFSAYELAARQKWAEAYSERLSGAVKTPAVPEGFSSSWAQYTLLLESHAKRESLKAALAAAGVPSMVYYPRPLHRQTVYLPLGYEAGSLPVSERLAERVLSLPMHPYLTEENVEAVCTVVLKNL